MLYIYAGEISPVGYIIHNVGDLSGVFVYVCLSRKAHIIGLVGIKIIQTGCV